jgi:MoaA/NifB/PqqE/SkfB family radical SAM enzyme
MITARHVKMAARFAAGRMRELHPFEVQAVLLNACNLKCVYCRCPEIPTRLMSTEQWISTIRGLGRLGTMRIKFQGGEPTLRRDFRTLCAESQAAGMVTAVISNGYAIAEEPELLDHVDELVVSLDSPRQPVNDALRGEGCLDKGTRAIELARQRGRRVFVNMVVTQQNHDDVEAMLDFCEARGAGFNAQSVAFGAPNYDDGARGMALSAEQTHGLHRRLAAWKRQGRSLMFSAAAYEKALGWSSFDSLTRPSEGASGCMAGTDYIHIDANGDVRPCVQHGQPFRPKNILQHGLEDALRNARRHECGDCFIAYLNERKLLFGLQPAAVMGFVRRG